MSVSIWLMWTVTSVRLGAMGTKVCGLWSYPIWKASPVVASNMEDPAWTVWKLSLASNNIESFARPRVCVVSPPEIHLSANDKCLRVLELTALLRGRKGMCTCVFCRVWLSLSLSLSLWTREREFSTRHGIKANPMEVLTTALHVLWTTSCGLTV